MKPLLHVLKFTENYLLTIVFIRKIQFQKGAVGGLLKNALHHALGFKVLKSNPLD